MKKTILLLSSLCVCAAMAAQEINDTTDIFHQHLHLNALVVTGLTGDVHLNEVPAPVSVIQPADLQGRASTNIIGAIAREPGVAQITTGGAISKPVIRGLGYNRVVVVNDGIRQEGQQWGDEHGIEIDGAGIHSVEILKGPASLMYGSDAMAGVLIFHPAPVAALGTVRGSVSTEYQSNNGLFDYSLNAAGNQNGLVWDVRFSDKYAHAYRNSADGWVPNSGFAERGVSGMMGLNRKWGYSRLKLSYYHLTPGIVEGERDPETGELEGDAIGYKPDLPFQQIYHYKAVLDNTFRLGEGRLKALLGWQQNRRQEFEESPDEYGLFFLLNTLNYDIKYQRDAAAGWKYAVGVNGMYQDSENKGDEYLIPDYRLFDAGLFATASRQWGDWSLSGGLRGDIRRLHSFALEDRFVDFNRTFPGLTGSLGAVRSFGDNVHLRANVSRGFRAPNLSELASNGEHEGTLRYEVGNRDLKPEYSLQGDLGLDFSTKYVSGQLALFANRIDNYIFLTKTAEGEPPVYTYTSGNARLLGLEAELDFHPVHSLHLGGTFSLVNGKQIGGDWLPMIPAPRLLTECKHEFSHGGKLLNNAFVAIELDWNFRQDHFYGVDGTETATPSYALLNMSAGTDIVIRGKKRASLYFLADNITDCAWQSHLSRLKYADLNPVTGRQGVFNMGRNFTVKLVVPIG
ncbi:MAG: TonB-dependent receptor [Bacteroidales bacterium]|nr:TonB-dependent receptor [Bacteroidales bacterium]